MNVKFGLRPKFFLIFFVFILVLSMIIVLITRKSYEDVIIDKYYDHAVSIANYSASLLDGDDISVYAETLEADEKYAEYLNELDEIKLNCDVYYLYVMYPYNEENGVYIFDTIVTEEQKAVLGEDSSSAVLGDEVEFGEDFALAFKTMKTGRASETVEITNTVQGSITQTLASVYAPIKTSDGKTIAFVGVDVNMSDVYTYVQQSTRNMVLIILVTTMLCYLILMVIVQASVIKPVRKLTEAAESLAEGNYDCVIPVRGNDEISEISRVFNRMSQGIKGHVEEINVINQSYQKYVPSKVFELLNKNRITDVKLGNQVQTDLSVMNFNIDGFNEIVRGMSSEEMFVFVNNIFQHMIPDVNVSDGMIDTFTESGFSALFSNSCADAVNSAISISKKMNTLNRFNRLGVDELVSSSIGITYGSVMVGIVGQDNRMSPISISEETAIAEYLEKVASRYNSNILVTGNVIESIRDFDKLYHSRFIGFMKNKSNNQVISLYDVYDGDSEEDFYMKEQTKAAFERGVKLYVAYKFKEARVEFIEVLKQYRKDLAAREYLYLCNQYYQDNVTAGEEIEVCIEQF